MTTKKPGLTGRLASFVTNYVPKHYIVIYNILVQYLENLIALRCGIDCHHFVVPMP